MGQGDVLRVEDVAELAREEADGVAWVLRIHVHASSKKYPTSSASLRARPSGLFRDAARVLLLTPDFGVIPGTVIEPVAPSLLPM